MPAWHYELAWSQRRRAAISLPREVADHQAAHDPALAAQLYADADYLAQLRKAPINIEATGSRGRVLSSTGLLMQDRDASQLGECALSLIEAHPLESPEAS
ncbi:MAG: hypothetical protein JOZ09_17535 [Pseudonocardiales bacterium]|nr:hypothetical protein [Pseudonocardiales bacterium]